MKLCTSVCRRSTEILQLLFGTRGGIGLNRTELGCFSIFFFSSFLPLGSTHKKLATKISRLALDMWKSNMHALTVRGK